MSVRKKSYNHFIQRNYKCCKNFVLPKSRYGPLANLIILGTVMSQTMKFYVVGGSSGPQYECVCVCKHLKRL